MKFDIQVQYSAYVPIGYFEKGFRGPKQELLLIFYKDVSDEASG